MLCNRVKKHYEAGEITRDQLLSWDDRKLEQWLIDKGEIDSVIVSPDDLSWQHFETEREARIFADKQERLSHVEHIKPFKTGLDWLVENGRCKVPLKFVLAKDKVSRLENLSKKYSGWYVYCFKK